MKDEYYCKLKKQCALSDVKSDKLSSLFPQFPLWLNL